MRWRGCLDRKDLARHKMFFYPSDIFRYKSKERYFDLKTHFVFQAELPAFRTHSLCMHIAWRLREVISFALRTLFWFVCWWGDCGQPWWADASPSWGLDDSLGLPRLEYTQGYQQTFVRHHLVKTNDCNETKRKKKTINTIQKGLNEAQRPQRWRCPHGG